MGGGHGGGSGLADANGAAETQDEGGGQSTPTQPRYDSIKQGAARYSFFDYPEPVVVADKNFNRGVSLAEFQDAADTRFDALDLNHDGVIKRSELPSIDPPLAGRSGKHGGGHEGGFKGGPGGGHGRFGPPGGTGGDGPPSGRSDE
jgi:hypothetical protein